MSSTTVGELVPAHPRVGPLADVEPAGRPQNRELMELLRPRVFMPASVPRRPTTTSSSRPGDTDHGVSGPRLTRANGRTLTSSGEAAHFRRGGTAPDSPARRRDDCYRASE